jgi:choline transport protein
MIILNYSTYNPERWQGTLLFIAIILLSVLFNTVLIRSLPFIESCILVFHIAGFFCIIIPLIMFGPRSDAKFVFTEFINNAGWKSDAVSWSVGLITSTYPFLCMLPYSANILLPTPTGYDGACHMAEEVESASIVVPRSIITTVILNGTLGLLFLLVMLFTLGDISTAISTPTGYPMIAIFYNATGSLAAATAMTSIFAAVATFATIAVMAATSRLTWAFARDNGLPFSPFLRKLHVRWRIPFNSIALTAAINILLSLIIVASTAAFNAIISLSVVALYSTYLLPIILILRLRLKAPKTVRWGPWRLGRWGVLVNIAGIIYILYTSIFLLFPGSLPVSGESMNYSVVVLAATLLFALVMWFVKGRWEYKGPLKEV